jgi:hypothetical protein
MKPVPWLKWQNLRIPNFKMFSTYNVHQVSPEHSGSQNWYTGIGCTTNNELRIKKSDALVGRV